MDEITAIERRDVRRRIYRNEVDRLDAIDQLADRLLIKPEYENTPAVEVWEIAAERIDEEGRF
jgi:hypothetical protein